MENFGPFYLDVNTSNSIENAIREIIALRKIILRASNCSEKHSLASDGLRDIIINLKSMVSDGTYYSSDYFQSLEEETRECLYELEEGEDTKCR